MKNIVFLSYAREDTRYAERLYMDLRKADINVWLDTKCLLPGQHWRKEVKRIIRDCAYFIALVSKFSLNKKGFVQNEMKMALEILKEMPSNKIFLIPIKLDDSTPYDEELLDLNWVNLYESYELGLNRILSVISSLEKDPLIYYGTENPYGIRAPIMYSPFNSFGEFVMDLLMKFPISYSFLDTKKCAMYITYRTHYEGVVIPDYLKEKYSKEMTIVLQNKFKNLNTQIDHFTIELYFNDSIEILSIPYKSVYKIAVQEIGLIIINTELLDQ